VYLNIAGEFEVVITGRPFCLNIFPLKDLKPCLASGPTDHSSVFFLRVGDKRLISVLSAQHACCVVQRRHRYGV